MNRSRAIRISSFGGPEVLELVETEVGDPGPDEVRIDHTAIGLNMIDTYFRSGLYEVDLPCGLGSEAAGIVAEAGSAVTGFAAGTRVAYAAPPPLDAYSTSRLIDSRWLVALPDDIDDETAAAMMLKGMTAWFLLHRSYAVSAGDTILLYAAAGGVGRICTQWASALGARVIGVVGSEDKREAALQAGCQSVLLSGDDVVRAVRDCTEGEGVAAVYDCVGRDTFMQSLDCLRPHGVMVTFGNSSGPVEPFSPLELLRRGSLYVTRPSLFDFIRDRGDLELASAALFAVVRSGAVDIHVGQRYALADASRAHRDLERRATMASTVLMP